ncbi:glutathione S-transferase family protein [Pseudomonas sp. B21-015]|uniref:glutathione S-transferase family protein n=1 Tax=Pseudomonas sp. B21-015 TaxID=2895473 RepID=UPI00215EE8C0|nr:glutathione S-transferase family protein [Pseudomonas sp. B21-015]UVM52942.1 glutathione S-transferase family protein [Pseudomonas sp. B21-015]
MSLTLYYHPLASYCHKVLIALYENGTDFERRIIDLADAADSAELQVLWPIGKFPVIRDPARQRDLPESSIIIIEYLDRLYPGEQRLLPDDWETALEVRLWDRFFDHYLQTPIQRIVSDRLHATNGDLTRERATLETAYRMLERRMASRIWVASPDFSLADCAAAPALFYACTLLPFPDDYQHLSAYFDRLIQRPSFQRVIDEARPWFSLYPFADDIAQRFRQPSPPP